MLERFIKSIFIKINYCYTTSRTKLVVNYLSSFPFCLLKKSFIVIWYLKLFISVNKKQIKKYKRHRSELIKGEKYKYTHEEIIIPIKMSCSVTPKAIEFRSKLWFKQHDIILSTE